MKIEQVILFVFAVSMPSAIARRAGSSSRGSSYSGSSYRANSYRSLYSYNYRSSYSGSYYRTYYSGYSPGTIRYYRPSYYYYGTSYYTSYLAMYYYLYVPSSYRITGATYNQGAAGNICKNYIANENDTALGIFACPLPFEPSSHTYCCGESEMEYCCSLSDSGALYGIVIGSLIGVGLLILIIACTIRCYTSKNRKVANAGNNHPPPPPKAQPRNPPNNYRMQQNYTQQRGYAQPPNYGQSTGYGQRPGHAQQSYAPPSYEHMYI